MTMFDKRSLGDFSAGMAVQQIEQTTMCKLVWDEPVPVAGDAREVLDRCGAPKFGMAQIWRNDVKDYDPARPDEAGAAVEFWTYPSALVYPYWQDAYHEKHLFRAVFISPALVRTDKPVLPPDCLYVFPRHPIV